MRFWLADRLVDPHEARVDVLDHGFTVGDGVFETLATVEGSDGHVCAFALDRHIARLARSAAGLGLAVPDAALVARAVRAVCEANPGLGVGGRIRITLTSGSGPAGSARGLGPQTLVITAAAAAPWPATTVVALSPWPRNERSPVAGLKTTSYAENVVALAHARRLGAGEALLANTAGDLCEGTGSNVFLAVGGRLVTPPLSSGCLAGITRELVLQWCRERGLDVDEVDLPMAGIATAEEIFLTSSTRDVHPVTAVLDAGGAPLWSAPGPAPLTTTVKDIFEQRGRDDPNP